jgi:hypothetical protein
MGATEILVEMTGTPGYWELLDLIWQELQVAFKISLMPFLEDANGFRLRPARQPPKTHNSKEACHDHIDRIRV